MKVAIVENEIIWQETIKHCLCKYEEIECISTYLDARSLFDANKEFDIVFFDIDLGLGINGLEASKIYKEKYPSKEKFAIILTNFTEYAMEGYKADAFRFIDKANLNVGVDEAIKRVMEIGNKESIVIPLIGNLGETKFLIKNIIEFLYQNRRLYIVTNNEKFQVRGSLGDIWKIVESRKGFLYVNKSEIINLRNVVKYDYKDSIIMSDSSTIYVSRRRKSIFEITYFDWRMNLSTYVN